ncbi:MAG: diguanylate cyclase [Spirochaetales bacterium]|nr:diguanylate cyclase [Spirochaetales bacterium]
MKRIISCVLCALLAAAAIIITIIYREYGWAVSLVMLVPVFVFPAVLSAAGGVFALLLCGSVLVLFLPLAEHEVLPVLMTSLFCMYLSLANGFLFHWKRDAVRLSREIALSGITDLRSGTYSGIYIRDILSRMMKAADRYTSSLTVCVIGLDQLDRIKKSFGDNAAGMYTRICIEAVKKFIRNTDIVGRIGEDLFLVLFDHCPPEETNMTIDRVRILLSNQDFHDEKIEVSCGLCSYSPEKIRTAEELIEEARMQMLEERKLKPEPLDN